MPINTPAHPSLPPTHILPKTKQGSALMPILAGRCRSHPYNGQNSEYGPGQTRTLPTSNPETPIPEPRGAKCVTLHSDSPPIDPQLQRLIGAWATLNQAAKEQIEQIIENAGGDQTTATTATTREGATCKE